MGSCYAGLTVAYARAQKGKPCSKTSEYAKQMDAINFYNTPKDGAADSCSLYVDNCVLHGCVDPSYEDDPEGAKWTALYMLNEPQSPGANEGAGCAQAVSYFQAMGEWYTDTKDFERGDKIFYRRSSAVSKKNPLGVYHTGLIVDWGSFNGKDGFIVSEGNTSGGIVDEKFVAFNDSKIAGAGRPRYDGWLPIPAADDDDNIEPAPEPTPDPVIPEPTPTGKEYTVSVNSFLRVRNGPGTDYPIVDKLYNGETVTVYEEQDGWGRISNDMYLWVSMDYLV
jgi:hypothetical protein